MRRVERRFLKEFNNVLILVSLFSGKGVFMWILLRIIFMNLMIWVGFRVLVVIVGILRDMKSFKRRVKFFR